MDTLPSITVKDPETPPLQSFAPRRILFDSPFSDYFTDTSLSPDPLPSPSQKALLSRLTAIGQRIARKEPSSQKFGWINDRLDGVEAAFAAPDTQSRQPPEMEDSGLFMDGDEEIDTSQLLHGGGGLGLPDDVVEILRRASLSSREEHSRVDSVADGFDSDRDQDASWEEDTGLGEMEAGENDDAAAIVASYGEENTAISSLLKESGMKPPTTPEGVLARINSAIMELRLRFEEVKYLNFLMLEKLDVADDENIALRNANDKLILDLHLDYSELLFLKIQLQAIEAHAVPREDQDPDFSFVSAIERLELDWRDVEKRFTERMEMHENQRPPEDFRKTLPEELRVLLHQIKDGSPRPPTPPEGQFSVPAPVIERLSQPSSRPCSQEGPKELEEGENSLTTSNTNTSHSTASDEEAQKPSDKSGFWNFLASAVGIIDYYDLFDDDEK